MGAIILNDACRTHGKEPASLKRDRKQWAEEERDAFGCKHSCACGLAKPQSMPEDDILCNYCNVLIPKDTEVPLCKNCQWACCRGCMINTTLVNLRPSKPPKPADTTRAPTIKTTIYFEDQL